jgi:hypothetical protein
MHIIVIAWLYVALMMGLAEATNSNGTILGGILTFVLYGAAPLALAVYLLRAPARRRAIKAREAGERSASAAPDAGGHAPADPVPPVREEP